MESEKAISPSAPKKVLPPADDPEIDSPGTDDVEKVSPQWGSGAAEFYIPSPNSKDLVFTFRDLQEMDMMTPQDMAIMLFLSTGVKYKPEKMHDGDPGYTVAALEDGQIPPLTIKKIATGVHIIPPCNFYMEVKDNSSVAQNGCITVGGVINSHYRGEIFVSIYNTSPTETWEYSAGDRIAQLVPRELNKYLWVDRITVTDAGLLELAGTSDRESG